MPRALLTLQALAIVFGFGLLAVPPPAAVVETYYAGRWYPGLQAALTSWSNTTAWSLFDVLGLVVAGGWLLAWIRWLRLARRRRSLAPIARGVVGTLTLAAVAYLWFAAAWGLNYARPPLESRIGYRADRVTRASVAALAERAMREVNTRHAEAHRRGFPAIHDVPPPLVSALHEVEGRYGRARATTPGRPKKTLLGPFFRAAGVDGMHAPFLLETLLNPDLTPPERPAVLAHEWAHLSGFAPEDDASFIGTLAALAADPPSQYSAWLMLFDQVASQLTAPEQRALIERLAPGPAADRRAIRARLAARVEPVAQVSWQTYDQYLRAQGVDEGVASYSRVVQLLIGSGALP